MHNHTMKHHRWKNKGRWHRYASGTYIYREDQCDCGCVRRVTIDDDGLEVVESYTKDDITQVAHISCDRTRSRKKKKGKKGGRGVNFSDFAEYKPPAPKENFIMITVPK